MLEFPQPVEAIQPLTLLAPVGSSSAGGNSFQQALTTAIEGLNVSVAQADALASELAIGKANIADAAIARAKADVMIEVAAIASSRMTGAITTLMQTQV